MRKKQLLIFLFLFFLFSGLILPNYNSALGNGDIFQAERVAKQAEGAESWIEKIGQKLGTIAKGILSGVIGAAVVILLLVTQGIMELGQTLLAWVTSEGFINIQFTDNPFVNEGWGIIRGLTNIFIVLGLVVIALATILRITSYQMKKTLPLLLIVALLINFTPMLCGLVIDASNIIMNHFLKAGLFLTQSYSSAIGSATSALWDQTGSPSGMLATGLVLVGSSLLSGIIFLLFAFLFLFRYIALWMLVILSPLALFCYIFPATKKIWDQWLNQFIQWCFIGIPAAFTIYLANMMTQQMLQGNLLEMSSAGKILGYIVPVAFLYGGLLMSLQTGAMGAGLAIKGFQGTKKWAGRGIEKGLKIPEKAEQLGRRVSRIPFLGPTIGRPLVGYAKRRSDELKKELEGLPFEVQAAMTGKSVQDIIRGLGPREFAEKARPDDITLNVFMAMSQRQVETTGIRGKPEIIRALRDLTRNLNNASVLQREYLNLRSQGRTQEADRLYQKTIYVQQNPDYQV